MKLRPPAIPLITVDPYFSVWSSADVLYDKDTEHWTASPNTIKGIVIIDGTEYRFMGKGDLPVIEQIDFDMNAFVSSYSFRNKEIILNVDFYTPLFAEDLYMVSRPVSYAAFNYSSCDGKNHDVSVKIQVSEELCINKKGSEPVCAETGATNNTFYGKIGSQKQNMLSESGDDLRINWGYFYLAADKKAEISVVNSDDMTYLECVTALEEGDNSYILFAYDDVYSLQYFGRNIEAYWKKTGKSISDILDEACLDAEEMLEECNRKALTLELDALVTGGEKYSELLALAYRQVIAAHKLAVDDKGNNVFVSKECFSNGCAATVDVTYPSSPMFILYNTELLKSMLRPVFDFAVTDEWEFDFAPHDVGQYPLVNGQVYGTNHIEDGRYLDFQMPVEECGNMIIMLTNICIKDGNTEFFDLYQEIVEQWVRYLIEYGMDPANQLCTDDFAGHLAHNCNLSLKAIMGIAGYSIILDMKGNKSASDKYMTIAKEMAGNWVKNAANSDGSFSLTFDRPDTFSMKYNMVWDKIWGTGLFAPSVYYSEFCADKKHINPYGMPLDNRRTYTKSDWLVWTACLAPSDEEFAEFIEPLWNCYNLTPTRVPMTDWYDTVTSLMVGFRHRSVQGGLFIKLMNELECFRKEN